MGASQFHFKKSLLASSVAAACIVSPVASVAQEQVEEEVLVTGILASLKSSMNTKREAKGVVDAITAEDIGKFPDTNLAESLQRITGVSIDRDNGEGSLITVRGFGPDFNLVTLNGRQMPTSSINATSANTSRSFDFANLASEGVTGVEVYKSGKANVPSGGVGSTINLTTFKPLESPGFNASAGFKLVNDQSSDEGDDFTPELSGLISQTFLDDTLGVSLSASYQNRQSGHAAAVAGNGWRPQSPGVGGWGAIPEPPESGNDPHSNNPNTNGATLYHVPQNLVYRFNETERTRTNAQLNIQFRPIENLTASLDYTYAENDEERKQNFASVWNNFGFTDSVWTDPDSNGVSTPLYIRENNVNVSGATPPLGLSEGDLNFSDQVSQVEQSGETTELDSLGIRLEYQVLDSLMIGLDAHSSSSETSPNTIYGNSNTIQLATNIRASTAIDYSSGFPIAILTAPADVDTADYPQPNPWGDVEELGDAVDRTRTTGTSFRNSYSLGEIDEVQLFGTFELEDVPVIESIDFGVGQIESYRRTAFGIAERPNWGGTGVFEDVPNELLTNSLSTIADRFDNLPGDKSQMYNQFFDLDFEDIAEIVGETYGDPDDPDTWPCGTTICAPSEYTTDLRTTEEISSAFLMFNLGQDFGVVDLSASIGVRQETTDVTSETLLPDPTSINWVSANEFSITRGDAVFFEGTGSYDNTLPNIDVTLTVLDDFVFRASYSETIARPNYNFLTAGGRLDTVRIDQAQGSRGNPGLLPVESQNIDLSFEWYYSDASYVSVGFFDKEVDNFISTTIVSDSSAFTVTNPTTGPRFQDALDNVPDGINNAEALREWIVTNNPDDPTITPADLDAGIQAIISGNADDSPVVVDFRQPFNSDKKSANGVELNWQHVFGDTGFGVIANYTMVDSDLEADPSDISGEGQSPLIGLSDTRNLVAFYDKYGIQVRLAYNWRDTFLNAETDEIGLASNFTEEYEQWDLSASYDIDDNFSVVFEAINLTDEYTRKYTRTYYAVDEIQQTGTRYNIGARYKF